MELTSKYELFLIFTIKQGEEFTESMIEKFKKIVEDNGVLLKIEKWGKRKFAYPIQKQQEGFYVLYEFKTSNMKLPAMLEESARITDGVMRSLIVKV